MTELGEPLLAVLDEDADDGFARGGSGWRPNPWWGWTLALLALGAGCLLAAGAMLHAADYGTSLRPRGCDASSLPGLGLLAAAGLCLTLAAQFARLRWDEAFLAWDAGSLVLSLPIPATLLALTLPGAFGCALGRDIARLDGIGSALVATPGIALAAGASVLVGVALGSVAHVGWVTVDHAAGHTAGIVELAIEEAEALRSDERAARFRGVDSGD